MIPFTEIVVHCSDSDISAHDNVQTIRDWHLKRGWCDIGYNFFIQSSGNIQPGRGLDIPGAHTLGHNSTAIGICLHGTDKFNDEQLESLINLINILRHIYGLDAKDVKGHYEYTDNKTCPNFDMDLLRREL